MPRKYAGTASRLRMFNSSFLEDRPTLAQMIMGEERAALVNLMACPMSMGDFIKSESDKVRKRVAGGGIDTEGLMVVFPAEMVIQFYHERIMQIEARIGAQNSIRIEFVSYREEMTDDYFAVWWVSSWSRSATE